MDFSTDVLSKKEERSLCGKFWKYKFKLVSLIHQRLNDQSPVPTLPLAAAVYIKDNLHIINEHSDTKKLYDQYAQARHRLACANVRLISHLVEKLKSKFYKLTFNDLCNEAMCGLLNAIDRFEVSRGFRLATYTTWWIRQSIQQAIAGNCFAVCLNPHHLYAISKSRKYHGVANGDDHDAAVGNIGSQISCLQIATNGTVSFDVQVGPTDFSLLDALADKQDSDDVIAKAHNNHVVDELYSTLSIREKEIVALRYGLYGHQEHTLRQIGAVLNLSKERVRQLNDRAVLKLQEVADRIGIKDARL